MKLVRQLNACLHCTLTVDTVLQLPTQDEVEYWHKAEKSGWLQSQGEHLRTWRRRWFVLKQGFLFRFADQNVVAATKPRGIVDLSKVTDVGSGRDTTGKNNSVTLSTATGTVGTLSQHAHQHIMQALVIAGSAWGELVAYLAQSLQADVLCLHSLSLHCSQ